MVRFPDGGSLEAHVSSYVASLRRNALTQPGERTPDGVKLFQQEERSADDIAAMTVPIWHNGWPN